MGQNPNEIVCWILVALLNLVCCFYVYLRWKLRRLFIQSESNQQAHPAAPAETLSKVSKVPNALTIVYQLLAGIHPACQMMRQTSRFKYERVHHDSNTSISVSPTIADLLAPVAPPAASTHGQPSPLSRLQLACRICNRAETCPQASPDVPAGTDAGGSRHPPGAPSAAGSDASNGRMSTDAAADADVDAEGWGGGTCFVCLDAAADAVLVQCGHGGLCAGAAALARREPPQSACCSPGRHCRRTCEAMIRAPCGARPYSCGSGCI